MRPPPPPKVHQTMDFDGSLPFPHPHCHRAVGLPATSAVSLPLCTVLLAERRWRALPDHPRPVLRPHVPEVHSAPAAGLGGPCGSSGAWCRWLCHWPVQVHVRAAPTPPPHPRFTASQPACHRPLERWLAHCSTPSFLRSLIEVHVHFTYPITTAPLLPTVPISLPGTQVLSGGRCVVHHVWLLQGWPHGDPGGRWLPAQ